MLINNISFGKHYLGIMVKRFMNREILIQNVMTRPADPRTVSNLIHATSTSNMSIQTKMCGVVQ